MEETKAPFLNGLLTGQARVTAASAEPPAPGEMLKRGMAAKRSQVGTEQTLAELRPSCLGSREARGDASQTRLICVPGSQRRPALSGRTQP